MSQLKGDPGYRDGWCIYYRDATRHDTCEAGIAFSDFDSVKWSLRPCFLDAGQRRPGACDCDQLRIPTTEEIAAHETWFNERMEQMAIVGRVVGPWREKHRGKSHAEVIECPACQGKLHLSIAAYNGHVHGKCETDGCVSWME